MATVGQSKSDQSIGAETESFKDITDSNDQNPPQGYILSLLIKITQPEEKPLPIGVITERSIYSLVKQVTGAEPLGVTVMNDRDVIIEFRPKVRLWEISSLMYNLRTWDKYRVKVTCLMSTKKQLMEDVKDREQARQAVTSYEKK